MTDGELTQLVIFETRLPADGFVAAWEPTATRFLATGLDTITLAEFDRDTGDDIAFMSRNTWPAAHYRRTFPGGLAADAAAGPIRVRQGGVFTVHADSEPPVATAQPDADLSLALVNVSHPGQSGELMADLLAAASGDPSRRTVVYRAAHPAQRYGVAVTVHGPAGTGIGSTAALRSATAASSSATGVFLTGRELLSLTS